MNIQKDISTDGGDLAGRDIDKRQYHYNFESNENTLLLMPYLEIVKKIEQGFTVDIEEQIDDILHYSGVIREDARGLEKKLEDSGRSYLIRQALRYKLKASRLITQHQDSLAFQYLVGRVLARIEVTFNNLIKPLILANEPIAVVETAIHKEVIIPIEKLLVGTPLGSHSECVQHLLYFLAGNCHISWDKEC